MVLFIILLKLLSAIPVGILFTALSTFSHKVPPTAGTPPKLTFDQYVKKLTGNYTGMSKASGSHTSSPSVGRLSLKVAAAPSAGSGSKPPLTIPVVNPAIKAALEKQQQQKPRPVMLSAKISHKQSRDV